MSLRKVNTLLLQQLKIDREIALNKGAQSSSHTLSKSDYLLIANELFDYLSVHVLYNENITNEEEQVVVVIGI